MQYKPTSHFLKIHLNIIFPSKPGSPKWSLSLRFPLQKPEYASTVPHTTIRKHVFKIYTLCIVVQDIILTNITVKLNSQHYLQQPYQHTSKWYYEEILRSLNNPFVSVL